jgi:hypothetical protein
MDTAGVAEHSKKRKANPSPRDSQERRTKDTTLKTKKSPGSGVGECDSSSPNCTSAGIDDGSEGKELTEQEQMRARKRKAEELLVTINFFCLRAHREI